MPDVVQIVDVYPHDPEKQKQMLKIDPDVQAQSLSMMVNALGREIRKIAIISKSDERRLLAYQRTGYETHAMNSSNRDGELRQFIPQMIAQIQQTKPEHTVLVSDDPEFTYLCKAVSHQTKLSVWANSATVPRELLEPGYGFRPLEELLPNLKIPRIDVRIDLENIFIGLVKKGWKPNLHELINAIREALKDLGEIVAITGYADWGELDRHHGGRNVNFQRELTLAGGESRYLVNQRGKNTADMKVVDDIRTLLEHEHSSAGAIDIIALATNDRDFRHIVETARGRGKKVVLLALKGGLSRELEGLAIDVRYLDGFLSMVNGREPEPDEVALAMRIAVAMKQNHWKFAKRDWLEKEFSSDVDTLKQLIADEWLQAKANSSVDGYGQARMLEFNEKNRYAKGALYMVNWLTLRIDQGLRKMSYVDSNHLAKEMADNWMLKQLNLARRRSAAENWLNAAASAGIIVAAQQPHPKNVSTVLTTWNLPQQHPVPVPPPVPLLPPAPPEIDEQLTLEVQQVAPVYRNSVHRFREMLTQGLSDEEINRVLFDNFREVYDDVGAAAKHVRIQELLEYVERRGLHDKLYAAILRENNTLDDEWQPLAA